MEFREQIVYDKGYRRGKAIGKASATVRLGVLTVLAIIMIDTFDVSQSSVMAIPFLAVAIEAWIEGRKLKAINEE